jgi:DNA-binding transcriptional LysR family regulator
MASRIDWESQIGRRLRLRDLHVFFTVAQRGSMAKAAQQLRVTQPAVSRVIADLEHTLGVRLLDRSAQGIALTIYGRALLKRGTAAFDELKLSIRDIEFLADPTVGEVRFACGDALAGAVLQPVIESFSREYPGVVLRIEETSLTLELTKLRERLLDFALVRWSTTFATDELADDFNVEILFNDQLVIAAGMESRWARRRKIDISELVTEPWILSAPNSWNYMEVAEAFRARGLQMPKITLESFSTLLRVRLLATGRYIATFPISALRVYADQFPLKALPVDLPIRPWPVVIVTLKDRTLSPVVERFLECARKTVGPIAGGLGSPLARKRQSHVS